MIPYNRQQKIMGLFKNKEIIYLDELVPLFPDVSVSTIRRDLKKLSDDNRIELLHGGAIKPITFNNELNINEKSHIKEKEKNSLAKVAGKLVEDFDIIYVDSGTTTFTIMNHITAKNVTVVTTNIEILRGEFELDSCEIMVLPGVVNSHIASISGTATDQYLSNLHFDKAFIGTTGFDLKAGITTPDVREATKKRIVMKNSEQTFLMADDSKFGIISFYKAFDIHKCTVITNKEIGELTQNNIEHIF
ncbi:DeoR/GlpR transcriptional regulator [Aerococcaceae bacterium zg-BR22]|uniref:DeoR/GlpR family DNA-binding transcription regulator n=1 Tax=Aerococcaceae bacterium zg-1292 TaxID=2774330 RepID=UPI004064BA64|nr:DeoR/GlpR transcriptional regulator [Aerococcaceae bacterium zg-BR22]